MAKQPLHFVCWLWRNGWNSVYDHRHVNRLQRMLKRCLTRPFRLICITDDPTGIECDTFPLWDPLPVVTAVGKPNCYLRLKIFDPETQAQIFASGVGSFVSMDLDCVIRNDISSLFQHGETFKACRGYRSYINGSMWQLKLGAHADVWHDFNPAVTPAMLRATEFSPGIALSGSDQAWMSLKLAGCARWTETDGVAQYLEMSSWSRRNPHPSMRIVFFCGRDKPWDPMIKMERSPLYDPIQA